MGTAARLVPAPLAGWLERRPGVRRVVGNMSWSFAFRGLQMVGALVVGVWVARYLGAAEFGRLNFAIAFVTLFSALASLGLDGILIRDLVERPAATPALLGTSFALKVAGGVVAGVAAAGAIMLVRHDEASRLLVYILAFGGTFAAFDTFDFWFQARVDARSVALARGTGFVIASAVKIVLVLQHAALWTFAAITSGEALVSGAALCVAYRVGGGRVRTLRWSTSEAARLMRDSWPLIFSGVMVMLYMRIDQVMLGASAGDRQVGIYSVAVRLAEAWYFIPTALVATVFPSVVEARQQSEEAFYGRLQRLYDSVSILSYAIAIPVTIAAPWAVRLLYGADYAGAAPVLIVLIWSLHFTGLGMARSAFLTSMNWTRVHLVTVCGGAAVNILLNVWLIPRIGALGAAIASLIAYWFAAHGACLFYPPLFRTGKMIARSLVMPRMG